MNRALEWIAVIGAFLGAMILAVCMMTLAVIINLAPFAVIGAVCYGLYRWFS